jgi:hypothetical protein
MSKIALESNPSGTGTFTIKSPNSNVDRELTLPDSAGEIYNRGNILGTVSQSSGVPTGAIIERGSNANGEFVKYADGFMIATIPFNSYSGIAMELDANDWRRPVSPYVIPSPVSFASVLFIGATNGGSSRTIVHRQNYSLENQTVSSSFYSGPGSSATAFNRLDAQFCIFGTWF